MPPRAVSNRGSTDLTAEQFSLYLFKTEAALKKIRAGRFRADDWRFVVFAVEDSRPEVPRMVLPVLDEAVRRKYLPKSFVLALLEDHIVRSTTRHKATWLVMYERVLGLAGGGTPADIKQTWREVARAHASGELDSETRAFVGHLLAGPNRGERDMAAYILVSAMTPADRSFALEQACTQAAQTTGDLRQFWTVAREAIRGQAGLR